MNYEIKRSKRKTLTIQVYRDQRIQVRAPLSCKDDEIASFFAKHENWVKNKLNDSQQYPGLPASQYINNGSLWLLGDALTIYVKQAKFNKVVLYEENLFINQILAEDKAKTERLITKWKTDFAAKLFNERLDYWSAQFPSPLPKHQFKLRKMKRQWGNCNSRGDITINSQLIRYPLNCIDYVLIHELTHLRHLNHGKAFYRLMEKVCPDWQQQRLLLSQFSGTKADVD